MSLIGGALGIALLNLASRNGAVERCDIATAYIGRSKLEVLLGPRIWDHTRDKDVLDFGCGPGSEAVEIAEHGARHVIGIDLRQRWLELGVEHAAARGVADRCTFAREWSDPVDLIVSLDSFEHFADPGRRAGAHARPAAAGRQGAGGVRADLVSPARRPHLLGVPLLAPVWMTSVDGEFEIVRGGESGRDPGLGWIAPAYGPSCPARRCASSAAMPRPSRW